LQRIVGFKKDGTTQNVDIIADGDPLKPQTFYPLQNTFTLQNGDTIMARCIYETHSKKTTTYIGKIKQLYIDMFHHQEASSRIRDMDLTTTPARYKQKCTRYKLKEAKLVPLAKLINLSYENMVIKRLQL
jgi:hypothetical protein